MGTEFITALKRQLSLPKNIIITTHHKPDADALGSSLALAGFLKKLSHHVQVITPTDFPQFLDWMYGRDEVIIYNEGNEIKSKTFIEQADIIFCLDFPRLDRINELGEIVRNAKGVKVLIDHHPDPENFTTCLFSNTSAAATAELVYEFISALEEEEKIDQQIANCLYAGIMADTGSFKHSNTTRNVFRIAAGLMEAGANTAWVARQIFDSNSLDRLQFLGYVLSKKLVHLPQYKTAYIAITREELKQFNSKTGDTEGLVNFALSIKDVIFAAIIIDRTETVKLSLRSVGNLPVNEIAKKYFEGGGHRNAAGGKSSLTLDQTVEKFLMVLEAYKYQLDSQ